MISQKKINCQQFRNQRFSYLTHFDRRDGLSVKSQKKKAKPPKNVGYTCCLFSFFQDTDREVLRKKIIFMIPYPIFLSLFSILAEKKWEILGNVGHFW